MVGLAGTVSFAFVAGVVAFFSPCSFPMLPSYISYYLGKKENEDLSLLKGTFDGFLLAAGMFTVLSTIGLIVAIVGSVIRPYVPLLELIAGVVVLTLGILMLSGRTLKLPIPTKIKEREGPLGIYVFGVIYAFAAIGCIAPIFIGMMVLTISQSFGNAIIALLAYSSGMGIMAVIMSILVTKSKDIIINKMKSILRYIPLIGGIILISMGIYLIAYYFYFF